MSSDEGKILNGTSDKELDKILEEISNLKVPPSPKGKERAWKDILQSIHEGEENEVRIVRFNSKKIWYSVAAFLIVLLAIGWFIRQNAMVVVEVSRGDYAAIVLPDNSEVKVNAESKIEYKKHGWMNNREVLLTGEAYFYVNTGSNFTVDAGHGKKVIVKGTEFNVFARDKKFEVKCFEGTVQVESPRVKPVVIKKGNGITIQDDQAEPIRIDLDSTSTQNWVVGEFSYQNTSLDEIFNEVQRQFNVVVTAEKFEPKSKFYTGYFTRGKLSDALDRICLPMGLTYIVSADSTSVIIKSE